MVMSFATITAGTEGIKVPGTDFGAIIEVTFVPQTENQTVTKAADGYTNVGAITAVVGIDGQFEDDPQIPVGLDQAGVKWKVNARAIDIIPGLPKSWTYGDYEITAAGTADFPDLIDVDVTVITDEDRVNIGEAATTATEKALEAQGWAEVGLYAAADAQTEAELAEEARLEAEQFATGFTAGTVTPLAPGADPTAEVVGPVGAKQLNLGIPGAVADDASMAAQVGAGGAFDTALSATYARARAVDLRAASGVDPTGATDSTAAMQAAVDAAVAQGSSVEVPYGTYMGSIDWSPGNNKDIYLKGGPGSVLKAAADGTPVLTVNGGTSNYQRQVLTDLKFDLNGKDAPAMLLESFGQLGVIERVLINNMAATPTRGAVEFGDGATAPNDIVYGIVRDVEVKGPSATEGKAFLFRSRVDSLTLENCRGVNIGTVLTNDPATCPGGSSLALLRMIAEQCQDGIRFSDFCLSGLLVWAPRVEAFSRYGLDLNGLDSNYVLSSVSLLEGYFSGMAAGSVGIRLSEASGVTVGRNAFHAKNGEPLANYPFATPVEIGANVTRYEQRSNQSDLATASGGTLVPNSIGPMVFPANFLPSTDIERNQTSADVPNQQAASTTVFTASGTFTRDPRAKGYTVTVVGGGGGGGSGRRGAAGSARCGGGAGGGAQVSRVDLPAAAVTANVTVTVGAGGAGGAAVTADNTDGNNGANGTASLFGTFVKAGAGGNGNGGTAATGTGAGTSSASGQFAGGAGASAGAAGAVGGNSANAVSGAAGGGGGGGITAADVVSAGGGGGVVGAHASGGPGAAGASGGGNGGNGTNSPASSGIPGPSGGGGGSSITGAAGAGGNGGLYGAGGGGGGASLNGNNSGKGGDGASGIVIVTAYY